jgi:hypothetical protein
MKSSSEKVKYVHIWNLQCWKCSLLRKDYATGKHSCPQNIFSDELVYPVFFGVKCARFQPTTKEEKNQ